MERRSRVSRGGRVGLGTMGSFGRWARVAALASAAEARWGLEVCAEGRGARLCAGRAGRERAGWLPIGSVYTSGRPEPWRLWGGEAIGRQQSGAAAARACHRGGDVQWQQHGSRAPNAEPAPRLKPPPVAPRLHVRPRYVSDSCAIRLKFVRSLRVFCFFLFLTRAVSHTDLFQRYFVSGLSLASALPSTDRMRFLVEALSGGAGGCVAVEHAVAFFVEGPVCVRAGLDPRSR